MYNSIYSSIVLCFFIHNLIFQHTFHHNISRLVIFLCEHNKNNKTTLQILSETASTLIIAYESFSKSLVIMRFSVLNPTLDAASVLCSIKML